MHHPLATFFRLSQTFHSLSSVTLTFQRRKWRIHFLMMRVPVTLSWPSRHRKTSVCLSLFHTLTHTYTVYVWQIATTGWRNGVCLTVETVHSRQVRGQSGGRRGDSEWFNWAPSLNDKQSQWLCRVRSRRKERISLSRLMKSRTVCKLRTCIWGLMPHLTRILCWETDVIGRIAIQQ